MKQSQRRAIAPGRQSVLTARAPLRRDRRLTIEPLEQRRVLTVVINEIMYHPASELVAEEFVELRNVGDTDFPMAGWRLSGVDFDFPDVTIPVGGFLVVAADVAAFSAKYPGVGPVVGGWGGRLSNQGERLRLRDQSPFAVDDITYADDGDWAARRRGPDDRGHRGWVWEAAHDGQGSSLELINAELPNEFGHNWAASTVVDGTPGAVNTVASANIAPLITETIHGPIIPTSTDEVTVTTRVIDEAAIVGNVTLWHRVDGAEFFTAAAMLDDGAHGDHVAGDGVFGAVLPPRPDGTVVEFYIAATDLDGLTRTWPGPTDDMQTQGANLLYQVLDAQPSSELPTYQVIMTEAERAELEAINRRSDAQMNASFVTTVSGKAEVRYNTGVRIRGSGSRFHNPPNYRVNIPADRAWQDVTQLNLNAVTPIEQVAGSALFAIAGLPAANAIPVTVLTNGANLMGDGFYAHVEQLNSEWAEGHFPDDGGGNVYRGRRPNESPPGGGGAGLVYFGPDPAPYVSYVKTSNASEADWSDVINLTFALNESPDETYLDDVSRVANIDQWLRTFALNALIDNNEFGLFNGDRLGDDYAMYRGIVDPRFQMVPHDLDTLFGSVGRPLFRERGVPALNRLVTHPLIVPRYYRQFVDLIENVITDDVLTPLLTAALGPVASTERIDQIREFLMDRAQVVRDRIPTQLTAETDMPVVDGLPRTNGLQQEMIFGRAGAIDTHTVLVNGHVADWSPFGATWQIVAGPSIGAEEVIVPSGAMWKYLDDGSDQKLPADGVSWFGHPDYDDSLWPEDSAEFGYGDGDEATVVSFGDDDQMKHITTYFRRTFEVADPSRFTSIRVRVLRDDGAAVYLNGEEIYRDNLDEDAAYNTPAQEFVSRPEEAEFFDMAVDPQLLLAGTNVLAAEVHQRSATSADMSFDLQLLGFDPNLPSRGLELQPGINRITVRALDIHGHDVESTSIDVWYNDGDVIDLPSMISADTTLIAADGPYRVTGDLTVVPGAELTIRPGTTVYFEPGAALNVQGRLSAIGSADARIRLSSEPGTVAAWNGIHFLDTVQQNRLAYVDVASADGNGESITAVNSRLIVDHTTWDGTDQTALRLTDSSWQVTNSVLPGVATGAAIEATGIQSGGEALIEANQFRPATGAGDAVQFSGAKLPGPMLQVLNNTFFGGEDDALVLDSADVYIEGNRFSQFHRGGGGDNSANAITAATSDITVVRNVFFDNDHAVLLREESLLIGQHNTIVGSTVSAINFDEPALPGMPGLGARLDGNIFHDNALVFENFVAETTILEVNHSLIPIEFFGLGEGNRNRDPRFLDPQGDFRLRPGSPALHSAARGLDMGAFVAAGAAVSGEPPALTHETSATLPVGGPGVTHYRYRLNDGPWSAEFAVAAPIELVGLSDGDYTVFVIGKNSAGIWQAEADATASRTWRVEIGLQRLIISEVLADNRTAVEHFGTFPDLIELVNAGGTTISLNGMRLSDEPGQPAEFFFPAGISLNPGERLVVIAGAADGTPGIHTGFGLSQNGEGVFLYDTAGTVIDSVTFGLQLPDFSISRLADDRWGLSRPTLGAANVSVDVGDPSTLKINEWLVAGRRLLDDDFLELYNPDPLPVELGGLYLSDNPSGLPARHEITPLSFIAGQSWRTFVADGNPENGADHLSFQLSALHEVIGLLGEDRLPIDLVWYASVPADTSQGRAPDGEPSLAFFTVPTPGGRNEDLGATTANPLRLLDNLRITELMYHAAEGPPLDFVELQNIGSEPMDLAGVRFIDGIDFQFGDMTLTPGQYVVVAADESAFRARYGHVATVAGEYALNLANSSETIRLQLPEPWDGTIQEFLYVDDWHPRTDGDGYSLVILDPSLPTETWNRGSAWRASGAIGGSPGFADPLVPVPGDTNGDGNVDVTDLNNVRNRFGGFGLGDANHDGRVDIADLNLVRNHFGAMAAGAAVGRPTTTKTTAAVRAADARAVDAAMASQMTISDTVTRRDRPVNARRFEAPHTAAANRHAHKRMTSHKLSPPARAPAAHWDLGLLEWLRGRRFGE